MTSEIVLPKMRVENRINTNCLFSGLDNPSTCLDRTHFVSYPYEIDYRFNARGFRDQDWPDNMQSLSQAIWCLGDSFTIGIGQPFSHCWPQVLMESTNTRTINVSMEGASNDWIARQALMIIQTIRPKLLVIMWSYLHRREHLDESWSDEDRRLWHAEHLSVEEDWENFRNNRSMVAQQITDLVEFAVPNFANFTDAQVLWNQIRGQSWPKQAPRSLTDYLSLPSWIQQEIEATHHDTDLTESYWKKAQDFDGVIGTPQLDRARDGHHFDILTSTWVVDQIRKKISLESRHETG